MLEINLRGSGIYFISYIFHSHHSKIFIVLIKEGKCIHFLPRSFLICSSEYLSPSEEFLMHLSVSPSSMNCSLESVNLQRNVLETLFFGENLRGCSSLEELDLSFNELTKLPDNMPATLVALKDLKLSKNALKIVSKQELN